MKKRFIILIDFSEYSGNLVKYAFDWSRNVNAELLLVHQTMVIVPVVTDGESREKVIQHINENALTQLKKFAKQHLSDASNVSYMVSERNIDSFVGELLEEPFEHLVFVGLKGTGVLKKIFLGSIALQIIESINNIIVAMPEEIDSFSPKKLHVAVSGLYPLHILELNNLLKFIDRANTCITFFHIAKPGEDEETGIEEQLQDLCGLYAGFNPDYKIYKGKAIDDMKDIIRKNNDEILIVQKGSRYLADQFFREFLINELVYYGHTPLIVLPQSEHD